MKCRQINGENQRNLAETLEYICRIVVNAVASPQYLTNGFFYTKPG